MQPFDKNATKVVGEITLHQLDDFKIGFIACRHGKYWEMTGRLYLSFELHVPDELYMVAATIISREIKLVVVWQSRDGRKHFVEPEYEVGYDPRLTDKEGVRAVFPITH
jgi:hypothetical protein